MVAEISVEELVARLADGTNPALIDVRERHEFERASIGGSRCVPLTGVSAYLASVDMSDYVVFVCETGERSRKAASFAASVGYGNTRSLAGGIVEWQAKKSGPGGPQSG